MTLSKQIIILLVLILNFLNIYSQEIVEDDSQSIVILSEDDITSIVKIIRNHKKEKSVDSTNLNSIIKVETIKSDATYNNDFIKNQITQLKSDLTHLNNQQPNNIGYKNENNNDLYIRKLNTLENEIGQLKLAIKQLTLTNRNAVTSTLPKNENTRIIEIPQTVYIKENETSSNKVNDQLLIQLDSLNTVVSNIKQPNNPNYTSDFNAIQERIEELKKSMQDKRNKPSDFAILTYKFKDYNKFIYFADNSKVLNLNASNVIEELFSILERNENLDLVVKGFASNKGNSLYNENLSMQRTESVKKALMIRGIHPTRVLTQYHGIDYKAVSETEARRVEVSILVRK